MNNLLQSYKTLLHLLTKISFGIHSIEKIQENRNLFRELIIFDKEHTKNPTDFVICGHLYEHVLIICSAFLDEFNREFTGSKHPEFKDRIDIFKRQIFPVTRRISKWKDIKNYRNYIMAHGLREKDKSIFDDNRPPIKYVVPYTNLEIKLLFELLCLITKNIGNEFPDLNLLIDFNETINDRIEVHIQHIDIEMELQVINEKIKILGLTKT